MKYFWPLLFLFFTSISTVQAYTIEFSETDLQSEVNRHIPKDIKLFFGTISVSSATVNLRKTESDITLKSDITLTVPDETKHKGKIFVSSRVRYDADTYSLYLVDPKVLSVNIDKLTQEQNDGLKSMLQMASSSVLLKQPIYTLSDDDLQQQIAKATLKSINIVDDKVVITLSPL